MEVSDDILPELCRRIGARGTNKRMKVINEFVKDHPETSLRQVTMKFSNITTKTLPACVPPPEKHAGRAFCFFLRPRYYHLLPEDERPDEWKKYAKEDEVVWKEECKTKAKDKAKKEQKIKDMMEDASKLQASETESMDVSLDFSTATSSVANTTGFLDGEETEDDEPVKKKKKKRKIH
eukprot:7973265-Ditylum_brightwellii.AAC.1